MGRDVSFLIKKIILLLLVHRAYERNLYVTHTEHKEQLTADPF